MKCQSWNTKYDILVEEKLDNVLQYSTPDSSSLIESLWPKLVVLGIKNNQNIAVHQDQDWETLL